MAEDRDKVGTGDPRLDRESHQGGASMPGTPGYEAEAAQRHRESNIADEPEIRSTSLVPGPLDDEHEGEPQVHFETLKWKDETRHHRK